MSELSVRPAFLLSLPRSGSTLLQRLLAAHSHIATAAEPWLLLPPLYALRESGVYTEYGHHTTVEAIAGLCENLPGGRQDYMSAVAGMAREVYGRLSPPGTSVFLDKTPRYGLIIEELLAAFPDAVFIVLHRNPLAVIASIATTFDEGSWKPYRHKQDLFLLADRLLAAQRRTPDAFLSIRYEDLVENPMPNLRRLIGSLGLEWEPQLLTGFADVSVAGNVGDQTGIRDYDHLSPQPLQKWRQNLSSPVRRSWARRYLRWLGEDRLALMGYDLDALLADLDSLENDYSTILSDVANTLKGVLWSATEVEIAREKRKNLPSWRNVFTHT